MNEVESETHGGIPVHKLNCIKLHSTHIQVFDKRMDLATTEECRIDSTTNCTPVNGSATSYQMSPYGLYAISG